MVDFEVIIELNVPKPTEIEPLEDQEFWVIEIARYYFDPGLQVGDRFLVTDLKIKGETFNFEAVVRERREEIIPGITEIVPGISGMIPKKGSFKVTITIETEKEEINAGLEEAIKRTYPN